jgi:hypothetical protein
MHTFMGFEIFEVRGQFCWAYGSDFDTLEDCQADITDYLAGERDSHMERMAEDAMERELMGE